MSVGDLKNNLRKLQSELRAIKYEKDVDLDGLSKGVASAFLPVYHYVFLEYSHAIAELIVSKDFEMCGKTDLRFVETMYKVLRDVFSFKPPVTKEQFFSNGFVERKVMMCVDVIRLIRNRNKLFVLKTTKSRQKINQSLKLGPRAVSTTQPEKNSVTSDKDSIINAAAQLPAATASKPVTNSSLPVQVINEIHHSVRSCPPAPTPAAIDDVPDPFRVEMEHTTSTEPVYVSENSPLLTQTSEPITVKAKVIREEGALQRREPQVKWDDAKAVIVNINSRKSDEPDSYNPARYGSVIEYYESPTPHLRPTDIIPKTPALQNCSKCIHLSPSEDDPRVTDVVMRSEKTEEKSESQLSHLVMTLQKRLEEVEKLLRQQEEQAKQREKDMSNYVRPEQIENLTARITLLENKVTLLDTQLKSWTNVLKKKDLGSQQNGHCEAAPSRFHASNNSIKDMMPPTMSEVEGVKKVDVEEHRCSTPNELGECPDSCDSVEAQRDLTKQKERIKKLVQSTEALLNIQVVMPTQKSDSIAPTD